MILKALSFVLITFIIQRVWKLSIGFGLNNLGYIYHTGQCKNVVPIQSGSEDIALTSSGLAFISSGLQLTYVCSSAVDARTSQNVGRIYLFDLKNTEKADAVELSLPDEIQREFNPHGIDVLEYEETGEILLYVVNHRKDRDFVEILSYHEQSQSLSLVRSVSDALFTSLNDVVAVDRNSFYAANDGYIRSCWRIVEPLLGLSWCSVIYFDGNMGKRAVESGRDFNSLALSRNGKHLYLTRPSERILNVYNRTKTNETLILHHTINVGVAVDNVFCDHFTGDLWLGAHPSLALLTAHFKNLDLKAPSQVIRIQALGPENDPFESYKIFSPFGDDGEMVSGSSSAVHFQGKLLIGTVAHKMAYCELN